MNQKNYSYSAKVVSSKAILMQINRESFLHDLKITKKWKNIINNTNNTRFDNLDKIKMVNDASKKLISLEKDDTEYLPLCINHISLND